MSIDEFVPDLLDNRFTSDEILDGYFQPLDPNILDCIRQWVNSPGLHGSLSELEQEALLEVAIVLLHVFVQANFTGPARPEDLERMSRILDAMGIPTRSGQASLEVDGERPYKLVEFPLALVVSCRILKCLDNEASIGVKWWWSRATIVHQALLQHNSNTLFSRCQHLFRILRQHVPHTSPAKIFLLLEEYRFLQKYNCVTAQSVLQEALIHRGFRWKLSGIKGRRTKFQTFDTTQLVLQVPRNSRTISKSTIIECQQPKTVRLDDDTILEQPLLSDTDMDELDHRHPISALEALMLLNWCGLKLKSSPEDAIRNEELTAYLNKILEASTDWSVYSQGLLYRSQIELACPRRRNRALLQIQALWDQIQQSDDGAGRRTNFFWFIDVPPIWDLAKYLGEQYMKFGLFHSALEIFGRLELWENLIRCHLIVGNWIEAKKLVMDQICCDPTNPEFHNLLGLIENNVEHYHKAWSLSNGSFVKAKRNIGHYYFDRKDYKQAVQYYCESLNINPLFQDIWFRSGYCYLQVGDLDSALSAFGRVLQINPEHGDAWNNMALIHWTKGQFKEAAIALKEAVKRKSQSLLVWKSFTQIHMLLGEIHNVILGVEKVYELGKTVDWETMELVADHAKSHALKTQFTKCLDRIETAEAANFRYWNIKARLEPDRAAEHLLQEYRCFSSSHPDYVDNPETFSMLARVLCALLHVSAIDPSLNRLVASVLARVHPQIRETHKYKELEKLSILTRGNQAES